MIAAQAFKGARERREVHLERCRNGSHGFPGRDPASCFFHLRYCQLARATDANTLAFRRRHARLGALTDQFPLELRQRGKDVKVEAPAGAGRVDMVPEGLESDTAITKLCDDVDKMRQRSAEAVELPDDENIAFLAASERALEARPFASDRRDPVVAVDALAAGSAQRVELQAKILVLCRYARVTDPHSHGRAVARRVRGQMIEGTDRRKRAGAARRKGRKKEPFRRRMEKGGAASALTSERPQLQPISNITSR